MISSVVRHGPEPAGAPARSSPGGTYGNCAAEGSYSPDGNGGITMTGQ
ncbi:hypothetical protein [Streptacidiphilus pinicola]|nr:hypothetical protein [Streptacidiphilus pinicola]